MTKKMKLKLGTIPAYEGKWEKKVIQLNLDSNHPRFGKYRKMTVDKDTWHTTAIITLWNSPVNEFHITLDKYKDGHVILCEEDILLLTKEIKKLKKIPLSEWYVEKKPEGI